MTLSEHDSHEQLIQRLTAGFGALLEQVQNLARKNTELEQRLAGGREGTSHSNRADGSSSGNEHPVEQDAIQAGDIEQSREAHEDEGSGNLYATEFMALEDKTNAQVIADGVGAWKEFTNGEGPVWRKWNQDKSDAQERRKSLENSSSEADLSDGDPAVDPNSTDGMNCPFAAMSQLGKQPTDRGEALSPHRPGSLPTPPPTQGPVVDRGEQKEIRPDSISPPPSTSGSVSKCPIRMLDERSPEEIAEYFETHKHEIPRSHEICVKRYQSNTQSIRQLDAKYGSLVNMIQGLGMKHQPLLPAKEDEEEFAETDRKAAKKVENWAKDIGGDSKQGGAGNQPFERDHDAEASQSSECDLSHGDENRKGYFDIPLKDVRVGESPSRPWGISVPLDQPKGTRRDQPGENTKGSGGLGAKLIGSNGREAHMEEKPSMIFSGPVFIGYPPEQAAALIRQCGWDPQGPSEPRV